MGTIGWTGNYRFTFEVDNAGNLRVISGINPYASAYELKPNEWFVTPEFIFTLSNQGTGKASRDIHDWARTYPTEQLGIDRFQFQREEIGGTNERSQASRCRYVFAG